MSILLNSSLQNMTQICGFHLWHKLNQRVKFPINISFTLNIGSAKFPWIILQAFTVYITYVIYIQSMIIPMHFKLTSFRKNLFKGSIRIMIHKNLYRKNFKILIFGGWSSVHLKFSSLFCLKTEAKWNMSNFDIK